MRSPARSASAPARQPDSSDPKSQAQPEQSHSIQAELFSLRQQINLVHSEMHNMRANTSTAEQRLDQTIEKLDRDVRNDYDKIANLQSRLDAFKDRISDVVDTVQDSNREIRERINNVAAASKDRADSTLWIMLFLHVVAAWYWYLTFGSVTSK